MGNHWFQNVAQRDMQGWIQAVSEDGNLVITSASDSSTVYFYYFDGSDILSSQINLEISPAFLSKYRDEAYTLTKHVDIKTVNNVAYVYFVDRQTQKKVCKIRVKVPLNNDTPPSSTCYDHDSVIHKIFLHPVMDEVVVVDSTSFHLIQNAKEVPFTVSPGDIHTRSLHLIKTNEGEVYYFAFNIMEQNNTKWVEVVKVQEEVPLTQYQQDSNLIINLPSDHNLTDSSFKRLQYSETKELFGVLIEMFNPSESIFGRYKYFTYFIKPDLTIFAGQSEMFSNYEFHMFPQDPNSLALIKYDSACFVEYETNPTLTFNQDSKACYYQKSGQRLYRVTQLKIKEEYYPTIQPTSDEVYVYDQSFRDNVGYFYDVSEFSVKKDNYLIISSQYYKLSYHHWNQAGRTNVGIGLGTLIGILIGSIFLLFILAGLCYYFCIYRRRQTNVESVNNNQGSEEIYDDSLKQFIYDPESQCPICFDINCNAYLPCSHSFHDKCLRQWMKKDSSCPFCRRNVKYSQIRPVIR